MIHEQVIDANEMSPNEHSEVIWDFNIKVND